MYTEIKVVFLKELNKALDTLLFLNKLTEDISKVVYDDYEITYWSELDKFCVGKKHNYQHLSYDEVSLFIENGSTPEKSHTELTADFGWSFH